MKISRDALAYGKKVRFSSIEEAVIDALTPNPYGYDGQLEKLKAENEKLREVLSRLIEVNFWQYSSCLDLNDAEKLEHILGYGYEVEL